MRKNAHLSIAGFGTLLIGGTFLIGLGMGADDAGSIWKPVLPEADLKVLVERASKTILLDLQAIKAAQDDLASGKVAAAEKKEKEKALERQIGKVRGHALLVAVYAQSSLSKKGPDAQQLASLRDVALQLADAARKKDLAAAEQLANALPGLKADSKAKIDVIALHKPDEREEVLTPVMNLFKPRSRAGLGVEPPPADPKLDGIEASIRALAKAAQDQKTLDQNSDDIARMAYQTAMIAELAVALAPTQKVKEKDPKKWLALSNDMRDDAVKLAEAAKSKNPMVVQKAASKLNSTCMSCHNVFRDADD